ncbi:nose resistant to fluoxetine protein 6 isoform X2 [Aethina tumida]|uniref:nose resistant to fluoxetine protein 6 isoform X2 n=1 Tax=Aethina tumida TaxID=116153 RepID=UPI00214773F5|nr:nose resistant to fluoxetine protein 6 isoform X2 [Aethina tumida]
MFLPRAIFVLIYTICVYANSTTENVYEQLDRELREMEYREGSTVEPKYKLPSVNVSVSGERTTTQTVTASLSRVLDFYNTELLAANWDGVKTTLSFGCKRDVELYLEGLRRTENWALKMDDASGRYSNGWFWGNHFWLGSQSLCDNITPKRYNIVVSSKNSSRDRRDAEPKTKTFSPSQAVGYKPGPITYSSVPPFPVTLFRLRLHLNSSFTTEERILHLGLCMPYMCTDDDIGKLVERVSATSKKINVDVEAVRSQHNRYDIGRDTTFQILCGVTTLVIIMLIIGTGYDYYIQRLKEKRMLAKNCSNYTTNLDLMPDGKGKNGLIFRETLLSFSLRANIKTICDKTVGSDTIPVIHGLKSISMAWVILGHTCIVAFKYSDNMEYRKVVQKEFLFQTILNGTFSVDTFFFTSGLLVSFLYFRSNAKGKLDPLTNGRSGFVAGLLHFLGLIFYRFARLTAPYLFSVGLVEVSMKWFHYNSVFEVPAFDHENCPKYWWRNILYINTLFPVEEMCMLWSWYLSDDTQFYIIGAVMLIVAANHFKSAAALLIIFMASSWITTGYIAYSHSHIPGSDDPLALFDKIYDKPWTRLGPYLIGMCCGWLLFKKDCRIRMSKLTIIVGWSASIAVLLSLVYGLYEVNLHPITGAAYSSLSHSAWALSLAWIVVACVTGHGGIANKVLSSTILYPFSRVTYCAYLIHPIVIRLMVMSTDSPMHLGFIVTFIIFLGQAVASYALAFFVSLAFEAPVVSMLRILSKIVANKKNEPRTAAT